MPQQPLIAIGIAYKGIKERSALMKLHTAEWTVLSEQGRIDYFLQMIEHRNIRDQFDIRKIYLGEKI